MMEGRHQLIDEQTASICYTVAKAAGSKDAKYDDFLPERSKPEKVNQAKLPFSDLVSMLGGDPKKLPSQKADSSKQAKEIAESAG